MVRPDYKRQYTPEVKLLEEASELGAIKARPLTPVLYYLWSTWYINTYVLTKGDNIYLYIEHMLDLSTYNGSWNSQYEQYYTRCVQ